MTAGETQGNPLIFHSLDMCLSRARVLRMLLETLILAPQVKGKSEGKGKEVPVHPLDLYKRLGSSRFLEAE